MKIELLEALVAKGGHDYKAGREELYNHRHEIIALVKAVKNVAKDYNNGCYLEDSAANLVDALAAFEEKK